MDGRTIMGGARGAVRRMSGGARLLAGETGTVVRATGGSEGIRGMREMEGMLRVRREAAGAVDEVVDSEEARAGRPGAEVRVRGATGRWDLSEARCEMFEIDGETIGMTTDERREERAGAGARDGEIETHAYRDLSCSRATDDRNAWLRYVLDGYFSFDMCSRSPPPLKTGFACRLCFPGVCAGARAQAARAP
jgi:hypothetical protein